MRHKRPRRATVAEGMSGHQKSKTRRDTQDSDSKTNSDGMSASTGCQKKVTWFRAHMQITLDTRAGWRAQFFRVTDEKLQNVRAKQERSVCPCIHFPRHRDNKIRVVLVRNGELNAWVSQTRSHITSVFFFLKKKS